MFSYLLLFFRDLILFSASKEFESSLKKRKLNRQRSRTVSETHSTSVKIVPEKKPATKLIAEEQSMKGEVSTHA